MTHKAPRQNSLVKFNFEDVEVKYHRQYPFTAGKVYVYLGEIPNMLGHCIVSDFETGKLYSGFKKENFIELSEDEL